LGGIVVNKSLRIAGDEMDQEIVSYAKNKYNLLLGERTAEEIKISIGNVMEFEDEEKQKAIFRGRDLKTGLPRSIEITPEEIREALKVPIYSIVDAVKDAIEETPAELVPDILKNGITLAGGTSLLRNLDKLMSFELKVPVRVAPEPMTCVVKGCGKVLDDINLLNRVKVS